MRRKNLARAAFAALGVAVICATPVKAQRAAAVADLADAVAGTYHGDVISDARGSLQSGVSISVIKVGRNLVEIRSDYPRIPTVRIPLTQAMSAILSNSADYVFLIDRERDPNALSLAIDDASLSLRRAR